MRRSLPRRLPRSAVALLLLSAAGLAARLWALGWRVAHQDEGRVAHWTLHYMQTGIWEYRPIIHGPFLPHVNWVVFSVFGASDFTSRLIVAVVGALLPLSAWLFRDRLRESEVVALGFFLAANPALLYYSRFMRNDVLLAGLMLVAFGFFVRAYDTGRTRYLYAGVAAFALAFTTKENALVYPVTWAGAAFLLFDHRVLRGRARGDVWSALPSWLRPERLRRGSVRTWREARRVARERDTAGVRSLLGGYPVVAALAVLEFFAIIVAFYAPLSNGVDRPGLIKAFGQPTMFPAVIEEATLGSWNKFASTWGGGMQGDNSYVGYFGDLADVLIAAAPALVALAVVGFVVDRYRGESERDVVAFCFYWGVASVLGYPVIVGNPFPWEVIHYVVPLAVPAAVGVGLIYRRGARAFAADDRVATAAAAVLLLLVAGQAVAIGYQTSFVGPQSPDNDLVQYAQPAGEMQPTLERIREISRQNEGVDVLFYGDDGDGCDDLFYQPTETWAADDTPPCGWFSRLPLPWYFEQYGTNTSSTTNASAVEQSDAPVVIALRSGQHGNPQNTAEDIGPYLTENGYRPYEYQQYLWSRQIVVYVREPA